jgi:glycosyltransferase involved in cell wall biosynthesis
MDWIVHLTSVHRRDDTRIYRKMCMSAADRGIRVTLVVADGHGNCDQKGITVCDVGRPAGRVDRIMGATNRVYQAALSLNADLYHLHDPELMPIGLKLKRRGNRVVFDAHEDLPKQLLGKPYLNRPMRRILAGLLSRYELYACKRFDGVITATPAIRDKFRSINPNTLDINNFPLLHELENRAALQHKRDELCYVGGIGGIRGIVEVCEALGLVNSKVQLNLVGCFDEPSVEQAVKTLPGWERVNAFGFLKREGVREVLSRSIAGLVTFHPLPNHIDAQPNKMFEYMSAGIPVIASDFPLWREIIAGNKCGLLVNPLKPAEIAGAIDALASNPERAQRMGQNGRKAVEEKYNWGIEERKLLAFYGLMLRRARN